MLNEIMKTSESKIQAPAPLPDLRYGIFDKRVNMVEILI